MVLDCLNNLTLPQIYKTLSYSGRGAFRLGKYDDCVGTIDMDYKLIFSNSPDSQSNFGIPTGLCVPLQCTDHEIKTDITRIFLALKLPLEVKTIIGQIPQYHYPFTIWFFIAFLLLTTFIVLFFMASCSKSLEKHRILGLFSLKSSMKIFKYQQNNLNVLNGVRALSMLWVIYGHQFSTNLSFLENSFTVEKNQLSTFKYLSVQAGLFAVDTFFFIGGFLAAYAVLKQPTTSVMKYPLAIVNRYMRIVPAYFMTILIFYGLFMHLGNGPFWSFNSISSQLCSSLWRPLLFIDNLVDNGRNMCLGWGWYLQNDMQLFTYCMILLWIYQHDKFRGYLAIFLSIAASFAYTMQQTFDNNYLNITHFSDAILNQQYQLNLYIKPWSRCPPYLYGLLLGMLYYQFWMQKKSQQNNLSIFSKLKSILQEKPNFRRVFQITGILLGCFICFIPFTAQGDHYWPQFAHSLYLTYGKFLFVFSLSIILLPSLLGIKSIVGFMMDTNFFSFIAKISFCTYLVHLLVLTHWFTTRKIDFYYAYLPNYTNFICHSISSMILGYLLTIWVEIPCSKLQKTFMKNMLNKVKQTSIQNKNEKVPAQ